MQMNVHAAKSHLSRLIAAAEAGEDVIIARKGRPSDWCRSRIPGSNSTRSGIWWRRRPASTNPCTKTSLRHGKAGRDGHRATMYVESHALTDGLRLADTPVAASAVQSGVTLMAANLRHDKRTPDVLLESFRP